MQPGRQVQRKLAKPKRRRAFRTERGSASRPACQCERRGSARRPPAAGMKKGRLPASGGAAVGIGWRSRLDARGAPPPQFQVGFRLSASSRFSSSKPPLVNGRSALSPAAAAAYVRALWPRLALPHLRRWPSSLSCSFLGIPIIYYFLQRTSLQLHSFCCCCCSCDL